jgi:S1-C subfamily serine protease
VVVRGVEPDGPAARAGLQPGDVVIAVNRQSVRSASDIAAALKGASSRPSLLLINRGGQNLFLTVNPE